MNFGERDPEARTVYRRARSGVKWVPWILLLLFVHAMAAGGDAEERLARARWFEERLAQWQGAIEDGAADSVLVAVDALAEEFGRDPRLHNLAGSALAALGRPREAVDRFERGIRLDPSRAELHLNLARVLVELGITGRALSEFEQSVELDPGSVDAQLGLGRELARLRRHEAALAPLERAHALAPDDVRVARALAQNADARGDAEASLHWWSWLERGAASADSARRLGDLLLSSEPDLARAHYQDCARRDSTAVDCVEAAATLALRAGEPEAARSLLEPRTRQLSPGGFVNLLLAAQTAGDLEALERVVDVRAPDSGTGWGIVALARRHGGQTREALAAIRRAVETDPESADLQNLLGVLLDESGDRPAARRAWTRALELAPDHEQAQANLEATRNAP